MSSLFKNIRGNVKVLDPGCGPGSLTAAFIDEGLKRKTVHSVDIQAFDIAECVEPFIDETLSLCYEEAQNSGVTLTGTFNLMDFITTQYISDDLFKTTDNFTHVIMNPPYKKISSASTYRKTLRNAGIETVNLYAGFVALAIQKLVCGGELVAIIPRSFCNGPYYQAFRELILRETAIQQIHIFDSRSSSFSDDDVLQENVIIHLIKGKPQGEVTITSSPHSDFQVDEATGTVSATDQTIRTVPIDAIVKPRDRQKFFHIAVTERDQKIIDRLSLFNSSLANLELQVSTGPVVDFRLKKDLRKNLENGTVPLIYPIHLNGGVSWPKLSKKPNAIFISEHSKKWLWRNSEHFVIVRRFSSKEEQRRIIAAHYDSSCREI
jgi:adenine-specific DNA-methyltransferase